MPKVPSMPKIPRRPAPGEVEDHDDLEVIDHGDTYDLVSGSDDDLEVEDEDLEGEEGDELDEDELDEDELDELEGDEDDELEDDELEGDEDDELEDDELEERPRRRKTAKERISELTQRVREAERLAFEAEMQALQQEQAAPPQQEPPLVEPTPANFEYGEFDPKYVEAKAEYLAEKRVREERARSKAQRQQEIEQERNQHYAKRVDTIMSQGSERFEDFAESVNAVSFDPQLARMILDSDAAVDMTYRLSKNIKELRRITRLGPTERARAIGQLEGRISATSAVRKKRRVSAAKTVTRKTRKAPKVDSQYGPSDLDAFEKAFFRR